MTVANGHGHDSHSTQRGRLIVFEGLDRSGKSTQCARLVDHLQAQGQKVEYMRFPNRGTIIGQMINNYLTGTSHQEDHAIHLLFSANRWEAAEDIKKHIAAGTTVVIDRYYYSGCVYSAAKQNPTMDLAWCRYPEIGLPRPDLCLFLDISAHGAAKRGGFGSERYEKQDMQDRVRTLFAEMRTHPDEAEDIVIINAEAGIDEVEKTIQDVVRDRFRNPQALAKGLRSVRPW